MRLGAALLCVTSVLALSAGAAIPPAERDALMQLYAQTGGPQWTRSEGWAGAPGTECEWEGVECDVSDQHVTTLYLQQRNLAGAFPASVTALPELQSLYLAFNELTGPVPDLRSLTKLEALDLRGNELTGAAPLAAPSITSYFIAANHFTGPIPDIRIYPELTEFFVGDNDLTGPVPSLTHPRLLFYSASHLNLNGSLPPLEMPELETFEIYDSGLQGALPAWSHLPKLDYIGLGGNDLSGAIPALPSSLSYFDVTDNELTGPLPPLPPLLSILFAPNNRLTGPLPDLSALADMQAIDLSRNSFEGPIPPFGANPALQLYWIRGNRVSGEVPSSITSLPELINVELANNGLTASPQVRAFVSSRTISTNWASLQTVTPSNVTIQQASLSDARVSWFREKIQPDGTSFEIRLYRDGEWHEAGTVAASFAAAYVNGLEAGKEYAISVRAVTAPNSSNANEVISPWSASTVVTPRSRVPEPQIPDVTSSIWVDPTAGDDSRNGSTRATAVRTLGHALDLAVSSTESLQIMLGAGTYAQSYFLTNYDAARAIVVRAADGAGTAIITQPFSIGGANVHIDGVQFGTVQAPVRVGVHASGSVLRRISVSGPSSGIDVFGTDVAILDSSVASTTHDAVTVQADLFRMHRSRITTGSVCLRITLGYEIRIEGNTLSPCSYGVVLGDASGMREDGPWIHYSVYGARVINNVVGASDDPFTIGGVFNALVAHNTILSTGGAPTPMFNIALGRRYCAFSAARCAAILAAGGWGRPQSDGSVANIPNRHVYIMNNVLMSTKNNPLLQVATPTSAPSQNGSNVPVPTAADEDLRFAGNVLHSAGNTILAPGGGCAPSHPTCNAAKLNAENGRLAAPPQFVDAAAGNYRPLAGGNLFQHLSAAIPLFSWIDAPPTPALPDTSGDTAVTHDHDQSLREVYVPGAYATSEGPQRRRGARR